MAWVWYSIYLRKPRIDLKHIHVPKKPLNQGPTFAQYMDISVWVVVDVHGKMFLKCNKKLKSCMDEAMVGLGGNASPPPPLFLNISVYMGINFSNFVLLNYTFA